MNKRQYQKELRERNDQIAAAVIKFLGLRGISIMWNGDGYYVIVDSQTLPELHMSRLDAYLKALHIAQSDERAGGL